jgi:hypothetical protein
MKESNPREKAQSNHKALPKVGYISSWHFVIAIQGIYVFVNV